MTGREIPYHFPKNQWRDTVFNFLYIFGGHNNAGITIFAFM
jgi:hypothetical protein